jgi:hypothetical protein
MRVPGTLKTSRRLLASQVLRIALVLCTLFIGQNTSAHEVRPAYLQIQEITPGRYDVLWRTPVLSGMRLPVSLRLPDALRNITGPAVQELSDSLVERRLVEASAGEFEGARIEFPGLQATITDVLVRVALLDGTRSTTLVRPPRPWLEIAVSQTRWAVAGAYLQLGVEHILGGVDHLLFVLALLLLVRGWRRVVATITAFTVAHSITLAAATLGFIHVHQTPVEAIIALSIVFVALEIVRQRSFSPPSGVEVQGEIARQESPSPPDGGEGRGEGKQVCLVFRAPWILAFTFGLLHGFGFAGALTQAGLPQGHIPLALLFFNLGVEAGQLLFIAFVLGIMRVISRISIPLPRWVQLVPPYAIGSVAMFWVIQRVAAF